MDYHIQIFDYRNITPWVYRQSDRVVLSTKPTGDLMTRIRKRVRGNSDFLNNAAEIRRKVLRFDKTRGVQVYYIRLPQEPTQEAYNIWSDTLSKHHYWVRRKSGLVHGLDPWDEYEATPEERQHIIKLASTLKITLEWPILDSDSLGVLQSISGPSSSTSGLITGGSGTTPQPPIGDGATFPGEMMTDARHEDVEMESPISPPFSPTMPPRSPEIPSIIPSAVPSPRGDVSTPRVVDGALISEASIAILDPSSADEVNSVRLQYQDILAAEGMITLRPHQLMEGTVVEGEKTRANATHYSIQALEHAKVRYLGRRGSIFGIGKKVPPCTFTQVVNRCATNSSIFRIQYDYSSGSSPLESLDAGGVNITQFWKFVSPPPALPHLGNSGWPSSLSPEAIEALSKFPRSFHRALHPKPIHGADIAGDGHGRSVFELLVPRSNVWHILPPQLSTDVNSLTKRAEFDAYNDPDASLVPLVQIGRHHLVHGIVQPAAGMPLAQYHLAGSRRIWIAVAKRHRGILSQSLPKDIPYCFWRHGDIFIRPDFLRDNKIPFTVCVQNPGDVVMIAGSALYESYDEGWNVIISVPYLDQHALNVIEAHGLISSDTCHCSSSSNRNRVVEKRSRVIQASSIVDEEEHMTDALFDSGSPSTDIMETAELDVEASLTRSLGPLESSIALDGPCVEETGWSLEPDGDIILQDYENRGVRIGNLVNLLSGRPGDLIGEVPRILVDMRDESTVTKARLSTQKLTEAYGGVIFQQDPPLMEKWSGPNSMNTLRAQFAKASSKKKNTLGRLDKNNKATTQIQSHIYHTIFRPLCSVQADWKRHGSEPSEEYQGLFALGKFQGFEVKDSIGRTPFEQCWDVEANPSDCPGSTFSEDILSCLTHDMRCELESLPADLSSWNDYTPPPYCAGIGANTDEEHVLKLTDHPLQDALAFLPQSLMMIALHYRSLAYDTDELDREELETIHSTVNEASSGTVFPWGYGGHHRTVFGIHFEDAWMPSVNLHVAGAPKVWLFIRRDDFQLLYQNLSPILLPCFPFHRSLFIHPTFLLRHKIRFTVARQTTGDMIVAGSTSAHLGWNVGPNLAVAANFLDRFSIDIICREVMDGEQAPWPCDCQEKKVPPAACAAGTIMNLPRHRFRHQDAHDVGSAIFEWIHLALPHIRKSRQHLMTDTGRFARVWRYLHELDGDDSDAMHE